MPGAPPVRLVSVADDARDAVLQERDRRADRRHLQLGPRRQRPAVVGAAQLGPGVAAAPLEQLSTGLPLFQK